MAGGGWPSPGLGLGWGGWSSLGPEVARLLSSPVDSEGGERRTWLAGRRWPTLCPFVCP